jgi:MoCo/4Fe-4S cofactor protein with predicted Tat translocation signal
MNIKDTFPELYNIRKPLKKGDVQARLRDKRGRAYWRSLEELAATDEFEEVLHREFPQGVSEWLDPVGRRTFLKLMGASLALAGVTGCAVVPTEHIVPYVQQPEEIVYGKPLFFATAMELTGGVTGLLVRSNEGRPTKIEPNPDHPETLRGTDVFSQASILTMYDPDRSQVVLYRDTERSFGAFLTDATQQLEAQKAKGGAGLRILTETVTSPTLAWQLKTLLSAFPNAKWYAYEPAARDNVYAGAQMAFGQPLNTQYRFDQALRVLSLDSNFLAATPGNVRYTLQFAARRKPENGEMNRLYAIETTPTNTGAKADHRLAIRPSEMDAVVRALAAAVGVAGVAGQSLGADRDKWIAAAAKDLNANKGASIVIVGDEQPAFIHALGHAMNAALGNVGKTVFYTEPNVFFPPTTNNAPYNGVAALKQLAQELDTGAVEMLLIVGGNPVYNAPADLKFADKLMKAKWRAHLSLYNDETSALCQWHIPATHFLEAWSDVRAADGTISIVQPLIAPLYGGRSAHEFLGVFTGQLKDGYGIVRDFWQTQMPGANFEANWRRAVHGGFIPNSAFQTKTPALNVNFAANVPPTTPAQQNLEIVFRPDPSVYDGRFANNGWLQELPRPLSKITWDNVAVVSLNTARELKLNDSDPVNREGYKGGERHVDVVELKLQGNTVKAPVWILPGQPDGVITVHLGYGRTRAGRVGNEVGFNAYALRRSDAMWHDVGVDVRKTGETHTVVGTQIHFVLEDRDPVRAMTADEYRTHNGGGGEAHAGGEGEVQKWGYEAGMHHPTLYKPEEHPYPESNFKWGMAIDNGACTGCNSCIIACQSENNIAVVGKEQVGRHRAMHWLRVDAYYKGDPEKNPNELETYFEPVPCMHCENAPCEPVCPVGATVHDAEGTNNMVYNRCIGTRYCSNNCPYKVRRFNFLLFQDWDTPQYKLMRNPEVTVRSRGVMEKCTYCIQRIMAAKIEAEKDGNRRIRDGEVLTACQAACPADAIVFGDMNDRESRVNKWKETPRNFALLDELNTRPRTTYLAEIKNINAELKSDIARVKTNE